MPAPAQPIRRRLDLKAMRPAGGVTEFLSVTLVDDGDEDRVDANELCELPAPDLELGDTGLTVEDFLGHWRDGAAGLDAAARAYGRVLYQKLLQDPLDLREAWQRASAHARDQGGGLRLEIRCPLDRAAHWCGQPLSALPFELLCDHQGYLFRRPGWSTVRRSRGLQSRELRLQREHPALPRVQVAWANVRRAERPAMDEQLFAAHDVAVIALAAAARAERLPAVPAATRRALADALERGQPHVLVWIGHGLDSGSGLLLHDGGHPGYPGDHGAVVSATDFATIVREGHVDVAMLWSCHGAGSFRALDVGVAEALLDPDRGDVAAVLASFSALDAEAVTRLSEGLIDAWAHGDGDLERALARARAQLDELSLTWARPVLFLRTPLGGPGPRMLPLAQAVPALQQAGPDRLRWVPAVPPHTASYVDHHQRVARRREDLVHHPVVVLEGLPGVGKTELALALVHELRAGDQDVVFVDLSGQRSLGSLRQTLGLAVSATPFGDEAPLLAALAGRRWTLVLDNAEDVLIEAGLRRELLALLSALRGTSDGFRAVVTSRWALATPGTAEAAGLARRPLALLDAIESRKLFIRAAGLRLAPAQAGRQMLEPLLQELGGIARAIVLMAGQLGGGIDVPELRRRLRDEGPAAIVEEDLVGAALPSSLPLDRRLGRSRLASALALSLASAARHAGGALDLFDALGTFPGGLLQALLPRSGADAGLDDALSALLDHHLVQLVGDERRIVMAAPVRAWAGQRWADRGAERTAACDLLDAIHDRLAAYAHAVGEDLGTERAQAARLRFLPEAANIVEAIATRAAAAWAPALDPVASSLFTTTARFAVHGGTPVSTLAILEPLAAQLRARGLGGVSASIAFELGRLKMRTHDFPGAREAYEEALLGYLHSDDGMGVAHVLMELGGLRMLSRDLAGAREAYAQALPIYRQIGDRRGEADALRELGDWAQRTEDLAAARQAYEQALPICRDLGDRMGEANTLHSLGELRLRIDADFDGARRAYEEALTLYRQIDGRLGEANALHALGDLDMRAGDLVAARRAYEQALDLYRQLEVRLPEADVLDKLGDLLLRTRDLAGARAAYERALAIQRQIGYRPGEAHTLRGLGQLSLAQDRPVDAFKLTVEALRRQVETDDRRGSGGTHGYLVRIATRLGAIDLAVAHGACALRILQAVDDRFGQMLALTDIGAALLGRDVPTGLAFMMQAQAMAEAIGDSTAPSRARFTESFEARELNSASFAALILAAPQIVSAVCEASAAAVAAGMIDLYALPSMPVPE